MMCVLVSAMLVIAKLGWKSSFWRSLTHGSSVSTIDGYKKLTVQARTYQALHFLIGAFRVV